MSIKHRSFQAHSVQREITPYGKIPPDVEPGELQTWILFEDDDLLVINKPGWLVCHPSKRGPMSSLIGAARVHTGIESLHIVALLDRETSGVVVLAKNSASARKYQMAVERRQVNKTYVAVLDGELESAVTVEKPIGKCTTSIIHSKMEVTSDVANSKSAVTLFLPGFVNNGHTFCEITMQTGRRHQIRVHAQSIGHPIVGDKIYGPDETLFIEFMENGWTDYHASRLPIPRQALHCRRYSFQFDTGEVGFEAPIPSDMVRLCRDQMQTDLARIT
ncbi:MAG: RluA family pseudouridine synthase [Planctomycetales bacterium]|nr:RluA family pseudouridine synthase [Planctomycetales bacterium]